MARVQSPAPASPGPPEGRKPSLAERLNAMAERHPVYADPGDPAQPATPEQAEATITRVLDPAWVRRFDTYTDNNGATMFVDTQTGQTYDKLPDMHPADGHTI